MRSRDASKADGVRLFSQSLVNVDAILLKFPGGRFVKAGQGVPSTLLEDGEDLTARGFESVELSEKSVIELQRLSESHVPHTRSTATTIRG